jgi:hypothetical protein
VHEAEFLAGAAEIGDLLGVDANTVNQWKVRHSDFPKPVRELKAGHVWDIRDVFAWAEATGRKVTYDPAAVSQQEPAPPVEGAT